MKTVNALVITGLNGSGKTKLIDEIAKHYNGWNATTTEFDFQKMDTRIANYLHVPDLSDDSSQKKIKLVNELIQVFFGYHFFTFCVVNQIIHCDGSGLKPFRTLSIGQKKIITTILDLVSNEHPELFYDDVECYLSVEWQRKLLPTLAKIPTLKTIIVTTHSPFIFENEFDKHAHDMEDLNKLSLEEVLAMIEPIHLI